MKTRLLPLSHDKFAIVDADRFDELNKHKWSWRGSGRGNGYAGRLVGVRRKVLLLHHAVLGIKSSIHVDHKNRNGLDCRRENLRVSTRSGNGANRDKFAGTFTSKYKGVVDRRRHVFRRCPWLARIRVNDELIFIGYYASEHEAAVAYDAAALHYFGEFARTNFPWRDVA